MTRRCWIGKSTSTIPGFPLPSDTSRAASKQHEWKSTRLPLLFDGLFVLLLRVETIRLRLHFPADRQHSAKQPQPVWDARSQNVLDALKMITTHNLQRRNCNTAVDTLITEASCESNALLLRYTGCVFFVFFRLCVSLTCLVVSAR